ncbi:AMP-binding protein [Rhodococcus aetherivorans]
MTRIGFWSAAKAYQDRIAVVDPSGTEVTYGELQDRANQLVHALRAMGVRSGDSMAILLPNSIEFVASMLAASQAGLYYTPINHDLDASEIAYILGNSDAKAFIAHEQFADKARAAVVEADLPQLRTLAVGTIEGFVEFADVVDQQPAIEPDGRTAGSPMAYTWGASGRLESARRPLSGMTPETQDALTSPMNMLAVFGLSQAVRNAHLCVSPLYHDAPREYALFALQLGHTVILTTSFDAEQFLTLVEKHRVTSTQMAPIQFYRLLKLAETTRERYDVSSLRVICHTAGPCPADVKRRIMTWFGSAMYESHSSGDAVGGILITPTEALDRLQTGGRPTLHGATVKILDELGNELPSGQPDAVYPAQPQTRRPTSAPRTDRRPRPAVTSVARWAVAPARRKAGTCVVCRGEESRTEA